jgi:hypothetical protein
LIGVISIALKIITKINKSKEMEKALVKTKTNEDYTLGVVVLKLSPKYSSDEDIKLSFRKVVAVAVKD